MHALTATLVSTTFVHLSDQRPVLLLPHCRRIYLVAQYFIFSYSAENEVSASRGVSSTHGCCFFQLAGGACERQ